ncbi:phage antirepressor protein [Candidatus Altiarchaeales archaeon WOR_SM1_SCG]|nr:phage antirepressor protein [Candidatus Altiarchaeales archaeon WOR_SM1_SCG]
MTPDNALVVFQGKKIRRTWHNEEWYFSVVDVCEVLTDSVDAGAYWRKLKQRLTEEGSEVVTFCHGLKLTAADGKKYKTDCSNTENIFRIIQSIPSKKAEPFKRWLAKVGYERIREIENPELAQERAKEYYKLKGYPKDWIDKRVRGIAVRQELTDEWDQRGIEEQKDYAILTNEISKATFGVPIKRHKQIKGLDPEFKNQNLRDHMTDLELIFTMLGEASTTEIARTGDAQGFLENRDAARKGGKIAGGARQKLEKETGRPVVSSDNYLEITGKVISLRSNISSYDSEIEKLENNSKSKDQKKN